MISKENNEAHQKSEATFHEYALKAYEEYLQTGEYITHNVTDSFLEKLAKGDEVNAP